MIYRMFGAFFFGATDKLESVLKREKQEPKVLILRMRKVVAMDATGLNALEDLYERLHRKGKHLLLSAPHTEPLMTMEKAGFLDKLGRENVCPHIDAALARARQILGLPPAPSKDPLAVERASLLEARKTSWLARWNARTSTQPEKWDSKEKATMTLNDHERVYLGIRPLAPLPLGGEVCILARPNVAKRMECVQLAAAFGRLLSFERSGLAKAAASCTHSIRFATFGRA